MSRPDDIRLDSWKEIADYLERDAKTVRRWETQNSLPVHRVPGNGRRAVFAYASEIDAWLKSQPGEGSPAVGPLPQVNGRRLSKPIFAVTLLLAVSGLAFLMLRASARTTIASVTFGQSGVVARDQTGKTLWTYEFGQALWIAKDEDPARRIQVVDLRGDGHQEVLVVAPLCLLNSGDLSTDVLYCFTDKGKVLWKRPFEEKIHFGAKEYGPRWEFGAMMSNVKESPGSIWCAVNNFPWAPSLLEQFDLNGKLRTRFVNAGHIHSLNSFRNREGDYILASGINNEYESAMLAVLKEENPSGSSPQIAGSAYQCDDCPSGLPYRYFLFPRTIVNKLSDRAYNVAKMIQVGGGGIKVVVNEALDDPGLGSDWEMYDFSANFVPETLSVSDHYWADYLQFYSEGRIKLSRGERPVRGRPGTVRGWDARDGWQEFRILDASSQAHEKITAEKK